MTLTLQSHVEDCLFQNVRIETLTLTISVSRMTVFRFARVAKRGVPVLCDERSLAD